MRKTKYFLARPGNEITACGIVESEASNHIRCSEKVNLQIHRRRKMKNAFIRLFSIMTLAISMSAFAAAGDCPEPAKATDQANQQQSMKKAKKTSEKHKPKKSQDEDPAEKEFERVLMGTRG
jgi:hypothetical protein